MRHTLASWAGMPDSGTGDTPGYVRVRPARTDDWATIEQLVQVCGLPSVGLRGHLDSTLVLERTQAGATSIVGVIALEPFGTAALLRSLAVHPGERGRGYGKLLATAILNMASRRGLGEAFLLTETAAPLFLGLGFQPTQRAVLDARCAASTLVQTACPRTATALHYRLPEAGGG